MIVYIFKDILKVVGDINSLNLLVFHEICHLLIFLIFFFNSLRNIIRESNSLDSDQVQFDGRVLDSRSSGCMF